MKRILPFLMAFCMIFGLAITGAQAAEPTAQLTLNDAITMALERNTDLRTEQVNIDKTEEQREDIQDKVKFIPEGVYVPGVSPAYGSFLQAQAGETAQKKAYEAKRQQLVVDVKNQYFEVLKNTELLEVAQNNLRVSSLQLSQARDKYNVGMSTKLELFGYETAYANAQSNAVNAQNELETSYTKLNILIGRNDPTRPILVDNVVYKKADLQSLQALTAQALSVRPEIWTAENAANVAKIVKDFSDNYNVGDLDAQIKEIGVEKAKDDMTKQVELLYLSIVNMEKAYDVLLQTVTTSEEKMRVIKIQNKVGMAIDLLVRDAEREYKANLASQKQLIYQHEVAVDQMAVLTGNKLVD